MMLRIWSSSNDDDLPVPPLRVATELVGAGAGLPQLLLVTQDASWTGENVRKRGGQGRYQDQDVHCAYHHNNEQSDAAT